MAQQMKIRAASMEIKDFSQLVAMRLYYLHGGSTCSCLGDKCAFLYPDPLSALAAYQNLLRIYKRRKWGTHGQRQP